MAYFGVDKHVRVKEQILQFQNIIRNRMTTSVRSLKGIFAQIDTNQSGSLDRQEFESALAAFG
jgi:Ca2+-binding EF-hand superfamily protein